MIFLDTRTLELIVRRTEHVRLVTCLVYHKGFIYSGSIDWQIRVWNADTYEHLGCFEYVTSNQGAMCLSADK